MSRFSHFNHPFALRTPSLFIVGSPFQVLCAFEAIKYFQITEYKVVVPHNPLEPRNKQVFSMLKNLNMDYDIFEESSVHSSKLLFSKKCLEERTSQQQFYRVFIGNFDLLLYQVLALSYLKNYGNVVYLDDGNSSIHFLKFGHYQHSLKCRLLEKCLLFIAKRRHITFEKNFFTVFSDIETKMNICSNKFEFTKDSFGESSTIFFVGTNSNAYAPAMGLSLEEYQTKLRKALIWLKEKYLLYEIVYVPHGRETNSFIKIMCNDLNIAYTPLEEAIELYLVKGKKTPHSVVGFSSSALFNIKKLFPSVIVYNFIVDNKSAPDYKTYREIADYYQKNGILNITL